LEEDEYEPEDEAENEIIELSEEDKENEEED